MRNRHRHPISQEDRFERERKIAVSEHERQTHREEASTRTSSETEENNGLIHKPFLPRRLGKNVLGRNKRRVRDAKKERTTRL